LLIEFGGLISFGYFGVRFFPQRWLRILGTTVSVGVIIILWGAFFAPKATYPLSIAWLIMVSFLTLLLTRYLWLQKGDRLYAGVWFVRIIFHHFFLYNFREKSIV